MVHERSGHGCSLLTNEGTHILVSGNIVTKPWVIQGLSKSFLMMVSQN